MTTEPTNVEKIRSLPWLITADVFNTGFALLTFSGAIFLLFLDELGLRTAQIGLLLSLIPFCGMIAPFIAPTVARIGYKRVFVTFWGIRKVVIALLLLTPIVQARYGLNSTFAWVAAIVLGFAICRAVAETGGWPWRKEAVPDAMRGKFVALQSMSARLMSIIATIGASYVLASSIGLGRFLALIAVGVGMGFVSVWAYTRVPGGAPAPRRSAQPGHLRGMMQAVRDRDFVFFLGALGLATVGGMSVISFVPLYMKDQVGLSDGNIVLLGVGTYAGAVVSSYLWGWTADRYGSKPIMQSSLYLMMLLPVAWFLMPRHSNLSFLLAMLIALAVGVATLAWQISWTRYLFVNAMPAEQKSPYMAVYYAWFGLVGGIGPLLAGQILHLSRGIKANPLFLSFDPYTPLFAMSLVLLAGGTVAVSRLRRGGTRSVGSFAGLFMRGNPLRAFGSLIQFSFSRDEMSRVATTERLGDAQSSLSANELIEALSDPSFNVRYEAIHSIGRMPPEPELVDALLDVLAGPESELTSVAARSLGRLGDRRAIGPLRKALFSDYQLLIANGARSLALLGDTDSIPHFLERFRSERDETMRIAYASALGKLRVSQVTGELFTLLRQAQSPVLRGEIGLALARIAGDERYYMQRWRSLHSDLGTAAGQAVLDLQRLAKGPETEAFVTLAETCAQRFAEGNLAEGTKLLEEMIADMPTGGIDETLLQILRECDRCLGECGHTRVEFILLTLHSLDAALRQVGSPD